MESQQPYEIDLMRGVAEVWAAAGLASVAWDADPSADGARWPIYQGPEQPLHVDEAITLTPRPHVPVGLNISMMMGIRLRSRAHHPDKRDFDAVRDELWAEGQALAAVLTPGGRPGGPYRFGRVNVGRVDVRPTLFLNPDNGDRFGMTLDLTARARPIRAT